MILELGCGVTNLLYYYYFTLQTKEEAECNKCKNVIKCKGLSSSGLLRPTLPRNKAQYKKECNRRA